MRQYSKRERILFGVLGLGGFLPALVLLVIIGFYKPTLLTFNHLAGLTGIVGGLVICLWIAIRGRSTEFLERRLLDRQEGQ